MEAPHLVSLCCRPVVPTGPQSQLFYGNQRCLVAQESETNRSRLPPGLGSPTEEPLAPEGLQAELTPNPGAPGWPFMVKCLPSVARNKLSQGSCAPASSEQWESQPPTKSQKLTPATKHKLPLPTGGGRCIQNQLQECPRWCPQKKSLHKTPG